MKYVYILGLLLTFFAPAASAATGNPGRDAKECVTAARGKDDVVFANRCSHKIFVVWYGEMKYTKKKCGDGPQGNSFYTQSDNIEPGKSIRAAAIREFRWAACEGSIGFGKAGIKDSPDGTYECTPTGQGAGKKSAIGGAGFPTT
jgi:hypothetical protein